MTIGIKFGNWHFIVIVIGLVWVGAEVPVNLPPMVRVCLLGQGDFNRTRDIFCALNLLLFLVERVVN